MTSGGCRCTRGAYVRSSCGVLWIRKTGPCGDGGDVIFEVLMW
jgi:hypothetical protein